MSTGDGFGDGFGHLWEETAPVKFIEIKLNENKLMQKKFGFLYEIYRQLSKNIFVYTAQLKNKSSQCATIFVSSVPFLPAGRRTMIICYFSQFSYSRRPDRNAVRGSDRRNGECVYGRPRERERESDHRAVFSSQ